MTDGLELREVFRHGRYAWCQFLTNWDWDQEPPKFIACHEPERDQTFIAKQAMGTWCEVDVHELAQRLNGNWPQASDSETKENG